MAKEDYREYHQQLAARLRSAAEHSTTKAIKARLVAEAEQHERIVRGEAEIRGQEPADQLSAKRHWAAIGTDREPTDSLRSRPIRSDRGGTQNAVGPAGC